MDIISAYNNMVEEKKEAEKKEKALRDKALQNRTLQDYLRYKSDVETLSKMMALACTKLDGTRSENEKVLLQFISLINNWKDGEHYFNPDMVGIASHAIANKIYYSSGSDPHNFCAKVSYNGILYTLIPHSEYNLFLSDDTYTEYGLISKIKIHSAKMRFSEECEAIINNINDIRIGSQLYIKVSFHNNIKVNPYDYFGEDYTSCYLFEDGCISLLPELIDDLTLSEKELLEMLKNINNI